jgi:hypothetical protein
MNTDHTEPSTEQPSIDVIDNQRRNITKLALWTPPVMMTLMLSKRASAASVVGASSASSESVPPEPTWGGY